MDNETLHSFISLEDFKAILGIDDREDALSRFCLTAATFTIEQYCKRRFFIKKHYEHIEASGDLLRGPDTFHYNYDFSWPQEPACAGEMPSYSENRLTGSPAFWGTLREYPVREVLAVYTVGAFRETGEPIEPDLYQIIPDLEEETGEKPEDTVYSLSLSPALTRGTGFSAVKVVYRAGYGYGEAPADLASACLELAAWNMNRYRGRRIGMTGNVRGNGKDGEHLEASMPENVRQLLEPYRRRII